TCTPRSCTSWGWTPTGCRSSTTASTSGSSASRGRSRSGRSLPDATARHLLNFLEQVHLRVLLHPLHRLPDFLEGGLAELGIDQIGLHAGVERQHPVDALRR